MAEGKKVSEYLRTRAAAKYVGIDRRTLLGYVESGWIAARKDKNGWPLFDQAELDRFLREGLQDYTGAED